VNARADLHTHSTYSDGALSPSEVVEQAAQVGLAAVAVTDHDTVEGVAEALRAGMRLGVEVVPSVEISATSGNAEVHVLGYFVDPDAPGLIECCRTLKAARLDRAVKIVGLLNGIGIRVNVDRVVEIAGGGSVGRPHVARAVVEAGGASSMDSAFGRLLNPGCPAYIPRYKVSPEDAVKVIIEAGGVACVAHVAKLRRDELIIDLIRHGLSAIEVFHPDHSAAGSRYYERFARERGLIVTGGSDAHCFPGDIRGGVGCVTVGYDCVTALRRARTERTIGSRPSSEL